MSFVASLVESRCLMIAAATSFWLPRGNIASSLPILWGRSPSLTSCRTSSLSLSMRDILLETQLLCLPRRTAISVWESPSSQ